MKATKIMAILFFLSCIVTNTVLTEDITFSHILQMLQRLFIMSNVPRVIKDIVPDSGDEMSKPSRFDETDEMDQENTTQKTEVNDIINNREKPSKFDTDNKVKTYIGRKLLSTMDSSRSNFILKEKIDEEIAQNTNRGRNILNRRQKRQLSNSTLKLKLNMTELKKFNITGRNRDKLIQLLNKTPQTELTNSVSRRSGEKPSSYALPTINMTLLKSKGISRERLIRYLLTRKRLNDLRTRKAGLSVNGTVIRGPTGRQAPLGGRFFLPASFEAPWTTEEPSFPNNNPFVVVGTQVFRLFAYSFFNGIRDFFLGIGG